MHFNHCLKVKDKRKQPCSSFYMGPYFLLQILANISKEGISCLSVAHEYFNVCYVAGLLPRNFDISKPQDKTVSKLYPKLVVQ